MRPNENQHNFVIHLHPLSLFNFGVCFWLQCIIFDYLDVASIQNSFSYLHWPWPTLNISVANLDFFFFFFSDNPSPNSRNLLRKSRDYKPIICPLPITNNDYKYMDWYLRKRKQFYFIFISLFPINLSGAYHNLNKYWKGNKLC